MSVVVVGIDHHTAPLGVLERMTVPRSRLPKALHSLIAAENISEAVVLSTCNRTEVYAVCETFHGALGDIEQFFSGLSGLPAHQFVDHLVTYFDQSPADTAAGTHLFRVAAGIESAVVGESEILGQVRSAWDAAVDEGAAGPRLASLFRHAVEVGKRARTETGIAWGTASVSQAAVELAAAELGGLIGRRVLVLGAGEIGVSMAASLHAAGVGEMLVANRTRTKAAGLASRIGGIAVPLHELPAALERVDLLLTATSATEIVLSHEDVEAVVAARSGRPLLIVDAALPRDVEPSAADIEGVTLLDLDAIRRFVETGVEGRRREIDKVEALVGEEIERYVAGANARQVAPVITALRQRLDEVRVAELARYDSKLGSLTPEQREGVEALTRQLIAKVAHEPTVRLKGAAGSPKGQRLADALRTLFDL